MSPARLRLAFLPWLVVALFASLALAQPVATSTPRAPAPAASSPGGASPAAGSKAPAEKRSFTDAIPCSACHTTTAWRSKGGSTEGVTFDHSTTGFPLTGLHARTPCARCHDATRTIKRACASCHEDFHRGRVSRSCDNCHSPVGWHATRALEFHRMTRFPLTGMHVLADCTECHRNASEHKWSGAPVDCFACHEAEYRRPNLRPVHVGTDTTLPFPRDCSECHRVMAWVPAILGPLTIPAASPLRVAPANHDLRFPLSFGVHRSASCEDCHTSLATPRAVRCIGCHAHDPVRLLQQHRQPTPTDGASCMSCHPGGTRR